MVNQRDNQASVELELWNAVSLGYHYRKFIAFPPYIIYVLVSKEITRVPKKTLNFLITSYFTDNLFRFVCLIITKMTTTIMTHY